MKKIVPAILIFSFFLINYSKGQIVPGEWRDHLPFTATKQIVLAGQKVYCATDYSLFYYNYSDNSVNKISKVNGLNDVTISAIGYSELEQTLIIAYTNSNIDLIKNNKIINIPDIKNKISISDKRVNKIFVDKNLAYLASNIGIIVVDLNKVEIKDTYDPSETGNTNIIYDVCSDGQSLYAATQTGIYKADINDPFLVNYSRWSRINNVIDPDKGFDNVEIFNNNLFTTHLKDSILYYRNNGLWSTIDFSKDGTIKSVVNSNNNLLVTVGQFTYVIDENLNTTKTERTTSPNWAVVDNNGTLWIADAYESLRMFSKSGDTRTVAPNGPMFHNAVKIEALDGLVWAAGGGKDGLWNDIWSGAGAYAYINNNWYSFNPIFSPELDHAYDIINVAINPFNPSKAYVAVWSGLKNGAEPGKGLMEITDKTITKVYTPDNSTLQYGIYWSEDICKVYGMSFDKSGNLWVVNSSTSTPISVLKTDGKWKGFSFDKIIQSIFEMSYILNTSWGHKWCLTRVPNGILIFDDNNTIDDVSDDHWKFFSFPTISNNQFIGPYNSIAEDKDGQIWIGTNTGPIVFQNPQNYEDPTFGPSLIKVPIRNAPKEPDGSVPAAFLLITEQINSVTVDGANRKWFGTQNSGAYLVSEDGTKEIQHFTAENSPLLSNTIYDISVDNKSGEVFFATENGIISYRGYATEGDDNFGKVYVFPNPVPHNYTGDIIITGLAVNANVKITDISGNLVFETTALGGQAVWNGKTLSGKKIFTGVYLVFCSNKDGSKTFVTKLLFIH